MSAINSFQFFLAYDSRIRALPREQIFNELPSVSLRDKPSAAACDLADSEFMFFEDSQCARGLNMRRLRKGWRRVADGLARAVLAGGALAYDRGELSADDLLAVRCGEALGMLRDVPSPPGSAERSRMLPLSPVQQVAVSQRDFAAPPKLGPCVRTSDGVAPDERQDTVTESRDVLQSVNAANSRTDMTVRWMTLGYRAPFQPFLYRLFDEDGTGGQVCMEAAGGTRGLANEERVSLEFDGELTASWTPWVSRKSRIHLCYGLRGLKCPEDPFALSTPRNRSETLLAQAAFEAALHSDSRDAALDAVRLAPVGSQRGAALRRARGLQEALRRVGVWPEAERFEERARAYFDKTLDAVEGYHAPIADKLFTGYGAELVGVEGDIVVAALGHFGRRGIPALWTNGEFIVPFSHLMELLKVLHQSHCRWVGGRLAA